MPSRNTSSIILGTCLALLQVSSQSNADLITEIEPNNTFASAQNINGRFSAESNPNIRNSTSIPHVTIQGGGQGGTTYDFYRFTVLFAGQAFFDIDDSPVFTNFDTALFLFGPGSGGPGTLLASNDDGVPADPGDLPPHVTFNTNSFIGPINLTPGDYVIGISAIGIGTQGLNGGIITGPTVPANGAYTLHISAPVFAIPEPASLLLLGAGLTGLAGYTWHRRRRSIR